MKQLRVGIALFCIALFASPLRGESSTASWTYVLDDDGIKVWRRDTPGQGLPGFRGEVVIAAPASVIVDELKKIEGHTEWMHRCAAAEAVKRFDGDHVIVYNRTDAPWPVWDRDVILDTRFEHAADGGITLSFRNDNPKLRPLPERVVRMPRLEGFYKIRQLEPARTRVVYQVDADIGGSVPKWMAERVVRDMPHETLSRLRARTSGR
ncbi:MAG: START domain-containing protein [Myxococcales bacterium]